MISVMVLSPENMRCLMCAHKIANELGDVYLGTEHFYLAHLLINNDKESAKDFCNRLVMEYGKSSPLKEKFNLNKLTPAMYRCLLVSGYKTMHDVCRQIFNHPGNVAALILKHLEDEG